MGTKFKNMKATNDILQQLADESKDQDQSIEEWLDFLQDLRLEVETWIDMATHDLKG